MSTPYLYRQSKRRIGAAVSQTVSSNGTITRRSFAIPVPVVSVHDEVMHESGNAALDEACRMLRKMFPAQQAIVEAA